MRVIDFFDKAAEAHPERTAFVAGATRYTYGQMQALSHRIGQAIVARGLSDAGRIAVYAPNDVSAFACVLGSFRANATWVPINARNALETNIDFMNLTQCEWLFYHSSFSDNVQAIRAQVPALRHTVCIDAPDGSSVALAEFLSVGQSNVVHADRRNQHHPRQPRAAGPSVRRTHDPRGRHSRFHADPPSADPCGGRKN